MLLATLILQAGSGPLLRVCVCVCLHGFFGWVKTIGTGGKAIELSMLVWSVLCIHKVYVARHNRVHLCSTAISPCILIVWQQACFVWVAESGLLLRTGYVHIARRNDSLQADMCCVCSLRVDRADECESYACERVDTGKRLICHAYLLICISLWL